MNLSLRPYQQGWLDSVVGRYRAGINRQLGRAATGTGKTVLFSGLPTAMNMQSNERMMVLVHREELATQAADKLFKWNPTKSVGVEMGEYNASSNNQIIVAGSPTIGRANSKRIEPFRSEQFKYLVVDEAHHSLGNTYGNIFNHFNIFSREDFLTLGVTATPNRADGKGLDKIYQEMVFDFPLDVAIRQGWLAAIRGIRVKTKVTLDEVQTLAGDFNNQQLGATVNVKERNEQIVQAWLKEAPDRQTVVFCVDIQHAKDLSQTFKNYGVKCEAIWGSDPLRHEKLKAHEAGDINVLCNCQILTEGYDSWRISCIIMARPTQSAALYEQIVGRGTRIPPDIYNLIESIQAGKTPSKIDCLIIDVVDASLKHSLNNVATLFGLQEELDTKGKSITEVVDEIEEAEKKGIDTSRLTDFSKLDLYIEEVDLFKVAYPDEIIQISDFQWHKTANDSYVLLLSGNESMVVKSDLVGNWHINGVVGTSQVERKAKTFDTAIKEADMLVQVLGGRNNVSLAKRVAKWHKEPPTAAQKLCCKNFGIRIPEGSTKGEVACALNKRIAEVDNKLGIKFYKKV